jgi:hypothetical protein
MLRLDIWRPVFFPETVRVGKGEVEEERSDNVFPATLSCRCVPHSCTTERSLGIFQSERLFSTHLGLRVFLLSGRSGYQSPDSSAAYPFSGGSNS